jgi:endonuclease/exonuclease/phosphatase family metal-dependent hydrolase
MTTEWPPGLTIESVEARIDARILWSKRNFSFFVRKILIERFADFMEEDAPARLLSMSDDELLQCNLAQDLGLDDVAIADFSNVYAKGLRVNLAKVPLSSYQTVHTLLDSVFQLLKYRERLRETCQQEIDMIKRGQEMRSRSVVEDGPTFVVSTYNINYAFARKPNCPQAARVVENVKRAAKDTDVLMFQETHDAFTALLDPHLSKTHPFRLLQNHEKDAGGAAVYSRYMIEHVHSISCKTEGSLFPAQVYRLQVAGDQTVWMVNVHLRPPMELTGGSGPFSMLNTSTIRRAEVDEILRTMGVKGKRLLIAGDWNENDGMPALAHCVLQQGFEDALGLTDKFTHWWQFAKIAKTTQEYVVHKRLDHILAGPGLRAESCEVFDEAMDASDHFLVRAKLRLCAIDSK